MAAALLVLSNRGVRLKTATKRDTKTKTDLLKNAGAVVGKLRDDLGAVEIVELILHRPQVDKVLLSATASYFLFARVFILRVLPFRRR